MLSSIDANVFRQQYASVFAGDQRWQKLPVPIGDRFEWEEDSTYIRRPPFLEGLSMEPGNFTMLQLIQNQLLRYWGDPPIRG